MSWGIIILLIIGILMLGYGLYLAFKFSVFFGELEEESKFIINNVKNYLNYKKDIMKHLKEIEKMGNYYDNFVFIQLVQLMKDSIKYELSFYDEMMNELKTIQYLVDEEEDLEENFGIDRKEFEQYLEEDNSDENGNNLQIEG